MLLRQKHFFLLCKKLELSLFFFYFSQGLFGYFSPSPVYKDFHFSLAFKKQDVSFQLESGISLLIPKQRPCILQLQARTVLAFGSLLSVVLGSPWLQHWEGSWGDEPQKDMASLKSRQFIAPRRYQSSIFKSKELLFKPCGYLMKDWYFLHRKLTF